MDKQLLLLGLLRQHEMHGYELIGFIEGPMNTCTDLKKPTAYFLLDKMAGEGWVVAHTEREGNRPARRVFRITPAGEAEFQRLLRENLAAFDQPAFTNDIGVAFMDALEPGVALQLLRVRRELLRSRLAEAERAPAHPGATQLLVDHQLHFLKSELTWLDQVIERVATQPGPVKRRASRAARARTMSSHKE